MLREDEKLRKLLKRSEDQSRRNRAFKEMIEKPVPSDKRVAVMRFPFDNKSQSFDFSKFDIKDNSLTKVEYEDLCEAQQLMISSVYYPLPKVQISMFSIMKKKF